VAAAGYDVTLVAVECDVDLPETGVRVITLPRRGRWQRMTWGTIDAVYRAFRTHAHLVHLHDPELVWAVPLFKSLGRTVIYDAHEDLPQQVHNKGYLRPALRPVVSQLSTLILRIAAHSNHVIAATETIAASFPSNKVSTVRNYPLLRSSESRQPLHLRQRKAAHLGVLSAERGAAQMVDSFASPSCPEGWTLVLAGAPSPDSLMDELRARQGWSRVDYVGVVSADDARDLLGECRVGLVVLQRSQAYLDSLPTKMFEYFAAGIPVVASDFPLWRTIVEEHDCGLLVDETDPDAIAEAIAVYAKNPELLARHGENARRAARTHLNWESESRTLVSVYERLILGRR
jgi:glycosyltransferase involved in cell wall biosynthesis